MYAPEINHVGISFCGHYFEIVVFFFGIDKAAIHKIINLYEMVTSPFGGK